MSRGMDLSFNMLVIAIVVGVVLALLVLIFMDQAQTFNDRTQENRCGFECDLLGSSVPGVSVSRPDTVSLGAAAVFRVIDPEQRFDHVYVEVVAPSEGDGITGRATTQQLDPGSGASVHSDAYEHTYEIGEYEYRLVGVSDSEETVIERGTFLVVESASSVSVELEIPERIVAPGTLHAIVRTREPVSSGRLVFSSVDDVVSIDLTPSDERTLAGTSFDGLEPGVYVLEPGASSITYPSGESSNLDFRIEGIVRVSEPVGCSSSNECDPSMPFCSDRGDGLVCSQRCAAAGERAADAGSCCADLRLDDGVCVMPGRALRFVIVPIGVDAARTESLASGFESSLREVSPLNACSSSRLSVETADASCASSCDLDSGSVSREGWDSCLNTILSCGMDVRLDLDRVIGVVGSDSMRIGEGPTFTGRAELGGRRMVVADPDPADVLHTLGHSFGLGALACGTQGDSCLGPNFADCGPSCSEPGAPGCFVESESEDLIMASCDRERFGDSGYDALSSMLAFSRATEVCR